MTEIITKIYIYCTDFTINLANLFDSTYEDINALIFCLGFPILIIALILLLLFQLFFKRSEIDNSKS
jgi:hypothetical protein